MLLLTSLKAKKAKLEIDNWCFHFTFLNSHIFKSFLQILGIKKKSKIP